MPRDRRPLIRALLAAAMLLMLGSGPLAAAGPGREPLPFEPFTLEGVCPFPVTIEPVTNKAINKVFRDDQGQVVRILVNGSLKVRLTNDDTGASIVENVSGPVKRQPTATGESWVQTGAGLWWAFPGEPTGPDLWVSIGRLTAEFDENFGLVAIQRSANERPLCTLLAG